MSRRDEDKKKRRQKRVERRKAHERRPDPDSIPNLSGLMAGLKQLAEIPRPTHWPGAADPSLADPDRIKFELAQLAAGAEPGRSKFRRLGRMLAAGRMSFLPAEMQDHWGIEAFLWQGVPGDSWHPVDSYLERNGERFPPVAQEQLRLWKQARVGLFQVGRVHDDTVDLQEWDPIRKAVTGESFRAIGLNIGGVNGYREQKGQVTLTYLAPWAPAENISCAMGYGATTVARDLVPLFPVLWLNHLELATEPLPWKVPANTGEYLRQWRSREWGSWLRERIQCPFWALSQGPPKFPGHPPRLGLYEVREMMPTTPEQAREMGIYFVVDQGDTVVMAGGTTITPFEITSPNLLPLLEYQAYRQRVGPPPGVRDKQGFIDLP